MLLQKDFYLTLLSSMHYGEQWKPSLTSSEENFVFLGKAYLLDIYCPSTRKNMNIATILKKKGLISSGNGHLIIQLTEGRRAAVIRSQGKDARVTL